MLAHVDGDPEPTASEVFYNGNTAPYAAEVDISPRPQMDEAEFSAVDMHPADRQALVFDPNFKYPDPVPPPTRRFFNYTDGPWWSWPDPIDNRHVRLTSFFIFVIAVCMAAIGHNCDTYECKKRAWSWVFVMWGDFFLRTIFGPTPFSPLGMIAIAILYVFRIEPDLVPSQAKRFSFFLGIMINSVMILLWWIIGTKGTKEFAGRPLIVLCVFSGLESIGGFCVGCWFFQTFFKLKDKWNLRKDYAKLEQQPNVAKKFFNPTIDGPNDRNHKYDVDLIVIGGGSGGLAAAKEAARLNQQVILLDYVHPSKQGKAWGVGGTCVNVGCIPKKLFHSASIVGHTVKHDAFYYGWRMGEKVHDEFPEAKDFHHNWASCKKLIQEHIETLNHGYETAFVSSNLQYVNARGEFKDDHTILATRPDGVSQEITARRIIVAVGGRPKYDDFPGNEYCISSDEIFSLEKAPGRTLVVGASYIALECAGFLSGLGMDCVVMARSKFLRGFDKDMAERIIENMKVEGTRFVVGKKPTRIEKTEDGKLHVFYKSSVDKNAEEESEVFDTVMLAIGRVPNTANLNLQAAGVEVAPNGKIYHYNERTTKPNIYALGDCAEPSIELTPVAIKQGLLLVQRLYNKATTTFDFSIFPTTVFTPVEYGSIGLSEEKAIETFGEENIEVYHSEFTPLEHYIPRSAYRCYCKLIVNYLDHERVIGFHYLGPNAGEVTQGYTGAFIGGLKKKEFDQIIGIHPTTAEELVTLRRSKRSGLDPKKTGC